LRAAVGLRGVQASPALGREGAHGGQRTV
jgi:hypothetical protein